MAQITFGVLDETTLDALKAFAATLEDVIILEEDEIFYPFSKEESERRLEESRKQLSEKGGISLEQLKMNIKDFKAQRL